MLRIVVIAGALALWAGASIGGVQAAEIIVVLMDANDEKSLHTAVLKDGYCREFLARWRQAVEKKEAFNLTFEAPPKFTGEVLAMHCILPDGSIEGDPISVGGN